MVGVRFVTVVWVRNSTPILGVPTQRIIDTVWTTRPAKRMMQMRFAGIFLALASRILRANAVWAVHRVFPAPPFVCLY